MTRNKVIKSNNTSSNTHFGHPDRYGSIGYQGMPSPRVNVGGGFNGTSGR